MTPFVRLNEAGRERCGEIFPNGQVPVLSEVPEIEEIEEVPTDVYRVNYNALTPWQQLQLCRQILRRHPGSAADIRQEIWKMGYVPIRAGFIETGPTRS